jgi:parallel beta helix pectate lyase-like protein
MGSATREPRRLRGHVATTVAAVLVLGALAALGAAILSAGGGGVERFAAPGDAAGGKRTFYVARTDCDDARPAEAAEDAGTPWCSLAHALAAAPSGSRVLVGPGRYPRLEADGAQDDLHAVAFAARSAADPAELSGIQLSGVKGVSFTGFRFSGGAEVLDSDDVRLVRNDFSPYGIYVKSSRHVDLVGNRIAHLRGTTRGLLAQGSGDPAEPGNVDLLVKGNTFEDIQHDAIAIYNSHRDVRIVGNVIRHVREPEDFAYHTDAMQLMGGDDVLVQGNVITDVTHGILVKDGVASTRLQVRGNLITDSPGAGLQLFNAPGAVVAHNTIWDTAFGLILDDVDATDGRTSAALEANVIDQLLLQAPGAVARGAGNVFGRQPPAPAWGTVEAAPPFVDAAAGDFRLRAADGAAAPGARLRLRG